VQKYVIQRLLLMVPSVFLITVLTFLILRVFLPGDVVDLILGQYGSSNPEVRAEIEEDLGLNGGLPGQYLEWTGVSWFFGGESGLLQGDMGQSLLNRRSVTDELQRRLPVSFELGLWAQLAAIVISVPTGVWAALRQDKWPDYGLRSLAILLNSVPSFWIAILIITFGSIWFSWAPPINFEYLLDDPVQHFKIMLLPALIIGLTPGGGLIRLVRTQMLEVLRQDYIRTAHAKGLSQTTVLYKHALRNAMIPVITVIGISLPNIVAGTVIFEEIFGIPGMGRYLVDAVKTRDYPVIQGLNVVFATVLLFSVLVVDLAYAMLDPRIRFQ
jgi:peptide/nickel transport system permease protein